MLVLSEDAVGSNIVSLHFSELLVLISLHLLVFSEDAVVRSIVSLHFSELLVLISLHFLVLSEDLGDRFAEAIIVCMCAVH